MLDPHEIFNELHHPIIEDGYLISPVGDIKSIHVKDTKPFTASYHSSNGYDYALFVIKEQYQVNHNPVRLFPIDEIIALTYIPIPEELQNKRITVNHINGDTHDISLENMEWVEDIEIWKDITYPGVKPGLYQISNHGRVRNKIRGSLITLSLISNYLYACLMAVNKTHICAKFRVHRLVAWEFLNNREIDKEVNHIDLCKNNAFYKNLEWIDRCGNENHYYNYSQRCSRKSSIKSELKPKKERLCNAVVQDRIRDEIFNPENKNQISIIYSNIHKVYPFVTKNMIYAIRSNKSLTYRLSDRYDLDHIKYPAAKRIKPNRLDDCYIDIIIDELLNPDNKGRPSIVYNKLKDSINGITIDIVKDIKRKKYYYVNRDIKHDLKSIVFPSCE